MGPSGLSGTPGPVGIQGEYKEMSIFCIKDYAFFLSETYYRVLILGMNSIDHEYLYDYISIKSIDEKIFFTIKKIEFDEHFIFGKRLREKRIDYIIE